MAGFPMYRLILLVSLVPLVFAVVARWWCGVRVLSSEGRRVCRITAAGHGAWLARWPDGSASAAELGGALRDDALTAWRSEDPRAAGARGRSLRFGTAVPPLSVVIAVFALLVGKIPVAGALAIPVGATALAAAFGLLSLPAELRAVARAARGLRESRMIRNDEDEEAVIRCAAAHVWEATLPPVLRVLLR